MLLRTPRGGAAGFIGYGRAGISGARQRTITIGGKTAPGRKVLRCGRFPPRTDFVTGILTYYS